MKEREKERKARKKEEMTNCRLPCEERRRRMTKEVFLEEKRHKSEYEAPLTRQSEIQEDVKPPPLP